MQVVLRAILILISLILLNGKAIAEDKCDALKAGGAPQEMLVKAGCVKPDGVEAPLKAATQTETRPQESAPPPSSNAPVSLFERYLSASSPAEPAITLKPFGYDLFTGPTLNQSADLPVSNDYIIGPGDEISVLLWGRVNGQHTLTVTREGTILFPNIGPLNVAGMTFDEMKRYLGRQSANIIGTDISVTAGRLRSIQVFVLGEVKKPGAYSLSAMSTITNALLASGGPTEIGSLRSVELKRGGKTVSKMDFYGLLLGGDRSNDAKLSNGDVVFVPTVGPLAAIAGNVRRPAVYELGEKADLATLLSLSGGIIPTAYTQKVQVERVEGNVRRIVVDVNASVGQPVDFKLQDADLVKVLSIVESDANAVYAQGNLKRPGKYELKPAMTIKDIVKDESDLLDETYLDYGVIKRPVNPGGETVLLPFSLREIFKGSKDADMELKPRDTIVIYSKWEFMERPRVSIAGEVRKPGTFELEENLTIKDLVKKAGDVTENALLKDAELYRTDKNTKDVRLLKFNLSKALAGDPSDNLKLVDADRVVVHSFWETGPKPHVNISGEVTNPGKYQYAVNMNISDLVFAGGGLLESAYLDEAELTSHVVIDGEFSTLSVRKVSLRKILTDGAEDAPLKPFDSLFIKKIPDWGAERSVTLSGEVRFPGRYPIKKGERLSSIIERGGGFTEKAYLKGAVFTRESVRAAQQERLDEYTRRLETELLSSSASKTETSLSDETAKHSDAATERKRALIAMMRDAKPAGRVVVRLSEVDRMKETTQDIALEGGDKLHVPERSAVVNVSGSVVNPASFIFEPGMGITEYIGKAGGASETADMDRLYVIKVDGSSITPSFGSFDFEWNSTSHTWDALSFTSRLDPGDTIIVPEEIERIAWMSEIKDLTQILYQIAVTAGVIIVAF
ncbi:MAG: SLBB domain-containing protein [Deltaproteobacteria bacterium]|nr:SLBB domain-containing protein [Deltaproteobacteria bacterium]